MGIALYLLSLAISVGLIIHVFKTGRNFLWITVLIFLPVAGAVAYFFVELLPEIRASCTAQRTVRGVQRTLDPTRDLRRAADQAQRAGDVASRQRYADELVRNGRAAEAVEIYRESATGLFATDPKLLEGMARAQFEANDPAGARSTLDNLIASNPEYKSPDGHLLYARALTGEGNYAKAIEEYAVLASYYPGAEASVRYAELLASQGRRADAEQLLKELLERARLAPDHYRKAQRSWLDQAERALHR
jgi:hypothetical protein